METIISMKDLSFVRQGQKILDQLNWQVKRGETWAILGLNGAGKSSLLRLIMAENWAFKGDLTVLGTTFGKGDIPNLRKRIGVVGSFIAERFPTRMLAEEIILTGRYKSSILYQAYEPKELEQAKDLLARLGGKHLIGRVYQSLSQGERQTLLIARSLMDVPDLLIFDEATSGLDLFARENLITQVEQIVTQEQAPTVLFVTHHAEEISPAITHLLLLKNGKIIAQGPRENILIRSVLTDFYEQPVQLIPIGQGRYFVQPEVRHA
ncbi:ABC transporter ATP-binding protein [Streptococcus massiliensis]|uniref:ABC transporter ATP-binding protein n=1 Tax=Streptococcus massiliensis TaxID=313439 RepID=A0A380L0L3_9STRE|nr:ABC transporter ATP-binding protein [Streptococcus massiliensis]SUN76736.1 ABC transporter ATP-binding protein [Streptococcus massiliensis]